MDTGTPKAFDVDIFGKKVEALATLVETWQKIPDNSDGAIGSTRSDIASASLLLIRNIRKDLAGTSSPVSPTDAGEEEGQG